MKKILLCSILLLAVNVHASEGISPAAESPLAPLASLVGGLWVGDLPVAQGSPPMKIVLSFAWAENKQAVRFDSTFMQGDKHMPYTSGLYGWNAAKGKLAIFYTDSSGSLTEGTITRDGDVLVNDLTVTAATGKVDQVRVRLSKAGNDVFTNEIFVQKEGAWAPFVTVRYERRK